jgi:hypothetical protein
MEERQRRMKARQGQVITRENNEQTTVSSMAACFCLGSGMTVIRNAQFCIQSDGILCGQETMIKF